MQKNILIRVLTLISGVLLTLSVLAVLPVSGAAATASEHLTAEEAILAELQRDPSGVRVGGEVFFPDGTVFVGVETGVLSLSQCGSNRFCIWSSTGYTGSFRYRSGTGTSAVGGSVGSFWNNRPGAARLYNNTGTASTCYAPGAMMPSAPVGYDSAQQVTLYSTTTC